MHKISLGFLTLAAATVGSLPRDAAPMFGPGAVVAAMRSASAALDAGDVEALRACFDLGRKPHVWVQEDGGDGHMADAATGYALTAVDASGKAFEATSLAAFAELFAARAGAGAGRALTSKVQAVRADCASPECSFAVADVERTYGATDEPVVVRVRVTALMRYDDDTHGFRVFHWHESARP